VALSCGFTFPNGSAWFCPAQLFNPYYRLMSDFPYYCSILSELATAVFADETSKSFFKSIVCILSNLTC
jgi:hypothetical protein